MSADPDRSGTIIDGKYELQRLIGRGGMGSVYAARQLQLDRQVAVKLLRHEVVADERAVARFNREARATARIEHPNAVRIYDFGATDDGGAYIVMEFVEGIPLRVVLRRSRVIPSDVVLAILWQAALGVAAAHAQGIVHRDLKPENLIVRTGDDGAITVKVVDFGLAKLVEGDTDAITSPAEMIGTPRYMAPEQFSGAAPDTRVDVYALGVILFEMIAGRTPFEGTFSEVVGKHLYTEPPPFESLGVEVPPGVEAVVRRALAKRPGERTDSVLELARAFARCLGVETPAATSFIAPPTFTAREGLPFAGDSEPTMSGDLATNVHSHHEVETVIRTAPPATIHVQAPAPRSGRMAIVVMAVAVLAFVVIAGIAFALRPTARAPLLAETPAAPAATPVAPQTGVMEETAKSEEVDDDDDGDADPLLHGKPFYDEGRIVIYASAGDFATGSRLEIVDPRTRRVESFPLEPNKKATKWVVKRDALSAPSGRTVESLVPVGTPVEMLVRMPDGTTKTRTLINRLDD